jgi:RNA ligase
MKNFYKVTKQSNMGLLPHEIITEHIDIKILEEYISKGLIRKKKHSELDLYIWNYTEKLQYNKQWDKITKFCRGIVTDFNGNIVARSFSKFFNLEEIDKSYVGLKSNPLKDKFRVYEKLDGSFGMLFYTSCKWIFCSRGSFTSEQAFRGKLILDGKLNYELLNKNCSYIFEIIYPENKIVVDYGNYFEDVILLTIFEKNGIERHDLVEEWKNEMKLSIVKEYEYLNPYLLKDENVKGREGYVLVFENGERLKIKYENYLELHKQLSNLTVQNAFDWIKRGEPKEKILKLIPDEYYTWYEKFTNKINTEYDRIMNVCINDFSIYDNSKPNKRDFASNIKNHPYKALMFKMYDNNTSMYNTMIFKYIEDSEFFKNLKKEDSETRFIDCQYNKYSYLNDNINTDELILLKHVNDSKKPPCYIFDIDGTLALNLNGRHYCDMTRVLEDALNYSVSHTLQLLSKQVSIIICTARSEDAEKKTKLWLKIHNINYERIYFRPYKNCEPDHIIKERMWRCINKEFNIIALYDDRTKVVNHARKLGLNVFQVSENNF